MSHAAALRRASISAYAHDAPPPGLSLISLPGGAAHEDELWHATFDAHGQSELSRPSAEASGGRLGRRKSVNAWRRIAQPRCRSFGAPGCNPLALAAFFQLAAGLNRLDGVRSAVVALTSPMALSGVYALGHRGPVDRGVGANSGAVHRSSRGLKLRARGGREGDGHRHGAKPDGE